MAEEISKEMYQEFLDGNMEVFDKIVLTFKDDLINFIKRYVKDYYVAEDISQDVFANIYVYRHKYNSKYSFKTYLYTIAKNKSIDYLRKKKDVVDISELQIQSSWKNIEDEVIEKESENESLQLLKKLKKEQEVVLYLADIEQMPYKDIAKITRKTVNNVKVTVHRARKSLKEIINERGGINAR